MSRQPIPERNPIGDALHGAIVRRDEHTFIALAPLPDAETVAHGEFVVRYGARYLGKPHISVVPGLIALDYGEMLTGEEAWEFLLKKSNLHPRADVVGYRNDGTDEMIVVKWLDLALTPEVLVYEDASATVPLARPLAIIAPDDADLSAIPDRTREYLPRFATIEDALASE